MRAFRIILFSVLISLISSLLVTGVLYADTIVYKDSAVSLYEQRLIEQQSYRKKVWDTYTIDWPDGPYVIDEAVDGLPGSGYEEGSVVAYLVTDCSPDQVTTTISSLSNVILPEAEAKRIDETFIRHQFTLRLEVAEGCGVQEALDELYECSVIDYAQPNHIYYADGAVRGGEDVTEPYTLDRNPDEAAEMRRKLDAGEISLTEWRRYVYDNTIQVYPGQKVQVVDKPVGDYSVQVVGKPGVDYEEGSVVCAFEEESSPEEVIAALDAMEAVTLPDGPSGRDYITKDGILHGITVKLLVNEGYSVQDAIDEVWECPLVAYVGPTTLYYEDGSVSQDGRNESTQSVSVPSVYDAATEVNDPSIGSQWWLGAVDAQNAWDISKSQLNSSVAILDTGFDLEHEDLAAVFDTDHAFNAVTFTQDVSPLSSHGTHVAGIVAAQANNSVGVAGVSYNARIVPIQVFQMNQDGSITASNATLGNAIDYVITCSANGDVTNLSAINMSLSGGAYDYSLRSKIQFAYGLGIVTVCAAGNGGQLSSSYDLLTHESSPCYPSDYEECISVCAVDDSLSHASFSEFNGNKDISAPGVSVYSTLPDDSYGAMNGTSMAAPVVSGVVALLYARNPSHTVDEVKDILYSTARDLTGSFYAPDNMTVVYGTGWDCATGYGLVDASAALEEALDCDLDSEWERLGGQNRYETSALVSSSSYVSSQNVIIATGTNFPDALSASALAGVLDAPILLVPVSGQLPAAIAAEITRLGATHAVIVGDTPSVSASMMSQVAAITGSAERVAGADRYATCLAIFQRMGAAHSGTAIICNGSSYPDAVSISPYAYASASAIFLTKADGTLTSAEVSAINLAGYTRLVLIGSSSSVSESVKTQLGTAGRAYYRIAGQDRYATNASVAIWSTGGVPGASVTPEVTLGCSTIYLSKGTDFPDALGAGSAAGNLGCVLLLATDSEPGRYPATAFVTPHNGQIGQGYITGTTASVPSCLARDYMIAAG